MDAPCHSARRLAAHDHMRHAAVRGARRLLDEVNLSEKLLIFRPERMKSLREHIMPLSSIAIEVLERRLKACTGDMVFAGRSGSALGYSSFVRAPRLVGIDAGRRIPGDRYFVIGPATSAASTAISRKAHRRTAWAQPRRHIAGTRRSGPDVRRWRPMRSGSPATPAQTSSPSLRALEAYGLA